MGGSERRNQGKAGPFSPGTIGVILMRGPLKLLPLAVVVALSLAACGTTMEQKAATGAIAGAVVGGPVGAAVGATAGAATEVVTDARKGD